MMEAEVAVMCSEDGVKGHKLRNVNTSGSWKRQGNRFSPRASRRSGGELNCGAYRHSGCRTSDLQNCQEKYI